MIQITPQMRLSAAARPIMAVADIFEALTAQDRPYRRTMKLSQALRILESLKMQGHIDAAVFDLSIASGLYRDYAQKELSPDQIDSLE